MSKVILVNGQNVEFSLDAQTSGTGTMKTPDLAGETRYQVPAASAAHAAELAKLGVHGADIASASTTNLETATGELVDVTGTTTITAITLSDGHRRVVRFTGILTLTHGASLVLPGAANIITAAGDVAVFEGYASSVVRCVGYMRAAAVPYRALSSVVTANTVVVTNSDAYADVPGGLLAITLPVGVWDIDLFVAALSSDWANAGSALKFVFTGTATVSGVWMEITSHQSISPNGLLSWSLVDVATATILNDDSFTNGFGDASGLVRASGRLSVTASGVFKIQMAQWSATAAQTVSAAKNSFIRAVQAP